jgi:hypothetical protein
MNRARRYVGRMLIVTVVVIAGADALAIDVSNPPQGVFVDEWLTMEMGGHRVGYLHSEISRTGDVIYTTNLMSMSLKRMESPVTITQLQTAEESLEGTPLAFSSQMDMSVQKMTILGRIEDGKVHVTSQQFGNPTTATYDYPAGALMSWGTYLAQHKKGFKPGTTYDLSIYEPSMAADIPVSMKVEIGKAETISLDGATVEAIKTTQIMKLPTMPTELETTAWINDEGTVLRTSLPMMGLETVMTRTTKAKALAEFSAPEFFMPTTIPARKPINRGKAQQIEYVLRLKSGGGSLPPIPTTGMQKPTRLEDGSVKLTVSRMNHDAMAKVTTPVDAEKYAEYLGANPMINADDAEVKKMAAKARGTATTPYAIADNLRRYVSEVIEDKNLDVGFASASEVCRNKQGDCSEHGVLLAALGRACGIPSRVVVGVVYVPVFAGSENIFGFHMWTQFLIGDQWVDFDAAQNETDCNPTHIAFSVASLQDAGLGQLVFGLMNVIGNLDIEIGRIEAAP